MNKKVFFPNLDGLRFIAFLCIFLCHSFYTESSAVLSSHVYQITKTLSLNLNVGVNLFFVLSGFLITYLLLDERNSTGRIHIKAFYMRRILRIWPLYYAVMLFGFYFIPVAMNFIGEPYQEHASIVPYIFFINNMVDQAPATAVLGILWSIAVEEQFYLFWPLIISFIPVKRYHLVFLGLILLSVTLRGFHLVTYENTFNCLSDLVLGSWIGYLAFIKHPIIQRIGNLPKQVNLSIYTSGILLIFTQNIWSTLTVYPFSRLILGLFFAFVIVEQTYGKNSFFKMENRRFITNWGKYTYGLYLLHFIAIYPISKIIRQFFGDTILHVLILIPIVSFIVALIFAYCSYHLYEKHFLKLKNKFSYFKQ